MNPWRTQYLDGIALWTPALPAWDVAVPALCGQVVPAQPPAMRPSPTMLAANERRRAPDAVLMALQVAQAALHASARAAAEVASVFASAHGDLAITDALCRTLADDPLLLSPMRFHHSVHNAASGYWAMASGSLAPSTALAAHACSFAAGLLEAACQCAADAAPVLLVASDTQAVGPLASVNTSRGLLALALLLAPEPGPATRWALQWAVLPGRASETPLRSAAARAVAGNAMAAALPLLERLAAGQPAELVLSLGPELHLAVHLQPWPSGAAKAASASAA